MTAYGKMKVYTSKAYNDGIKKNDVVRISKAYNY